MKKFFTIIFVLFGITSYAQTTTVSAGNVTATAGENVIVPINVQNFVNIGAITIKIQYDVNVLTWIEALNWDSQLPGAIATGISGVVTIAWDGLTGVNINDGKLVDLKFLYNGGSTGIDFIVAQCEIADENGNIIAVSYVNGSVNPINLITVTVNTNPNGRSFTVDGTTHTTQQVFSWQPGSSHTISTTSQQSGGTGTQYVWTSWSDEGNISHTVSPIVSTTYTANFDTEYYLTMLARTGGSVTPLSGWRQSGENVQIQAYPDGTHNFAGWAGSGLGSYTGNNNPAQITMNGTITEQANFGENDTLLTVTSPNGGEDLYTDGTHTITWTDNISENVQIWLMKGGLGEALVTSSTPSDGNHPWQIHTNLPQGSDYKIMIRGVNNPNIIDYSDNYFTMNTITVISPNGGENWHTGTTQTITWTDNISQNVRIRLQKGLANSSIIVSSTPNDGSHPWQIPMNQTPGSDYRIEIESVNYPPMYDFSGNDFTISKSTNVDLTDGTLPDSYKLLQNYPNPFNPSTTIYYSIPELSNVILKVYNVLGDEVSVLVNEEKSVGNYEVEFDLTRLPSGIYFYQLQAGNFIETKKMVLMK